MQPADKTARAELLWLYSRHQAVFPCMDTLSGWLASDSHYQREEGDYCPFDCWVCAEQRIIDRAYTSPEDW